jgi:hypothetical protein
MKMDFDELVKGFIILAVVYGVAALVSIGVSIWAVIYVVTHIGGWIN